MPSTPARIDHTSASAAASLPPPVSCAAFEEVRVKRVSAVTANASPPSLAEGASTSLRTPAAPMTIESSVAARVPPP